MIEETGIIQANKITKNGECNKDIHYNNENQIISRSSFLITNWRVTLLPGFIFTRQITDAILRYPLFFQNRNVNSTIKHERNFDYYAASENNEVKPR
jgi:hypothetical protein